MLNMSNKISIHNGKYTAKEGKGMLLCRTPWCQRYNFETQGCAQSKTTAGTMTC